MRRNHPKTIRTAIDTATRETALWKSLCRRHLPLSVEGSIWRYNLEAGLAGPSQGWKIHISATVLNARPILERVAPFLTAQNVRFKAPESLAELSKINSAKVYGYSQVGKCITVYPDTVNEAIHLARKLHKLTRGFKSPARLTRGYVRAAVYIIAMARLSRSRRPVRTESRRSL
jgi:hypothetical protein